MRTKLSVEWLFAFLSIFFLLNELHDWAHVLVGLVISGCWGTKGFDSWTLCKTKDASGSLALLSWLAGPLLIYMAIWAGYFLMKSRNSLANRSLGFSILFAAMPFARILATIRGNSDELFVLREFFHHTDAANGPFIFTTGLLLVFVLTVPPLAKAFKMLRGSKGKLWLFSLFLFAPIVIDYLVLWLGMNTLLSAGIMDDESLPGTPFLVVMWGLSWLIVLMFVYPHLLKLFRRSHQRRKKKTNMVITE